VTDVFINGRFLIQTVTGVQRYAMEVVQALDELLSKAHSSQPFTLLLPRDVSQIPDYQHIKSKHVGRHRGIFWEQLDLPIAAKSGLLLNLGSTGPLGHKNQVVTFHDAGIFRIPGNFTVAFLLWYRLLMPILGRKAKRVLTVSEFSKQELSSCAGISKHKLVVTHNSAAHIVRHPADRQILAKNNLLPKSYLLFVGGDKPNKNIAIVIDALAALDDRAVSLVCVGETDPAVFAKPLYHSRSEIHALGRVTDAELRALYENASCLLFPSFYEGFGIPPLEAMQCGCPVIASNTSALPEIYGGAALLFDPNDIRGLCDHIRRLQLDDEAREQLIRAGIARAKSFSWEDCAAKVLEQIDELSKS